MSDADTLKPGWRLMWSIWHHFDQGKSACGKFRMALTEGARKAAPQHRDLTAAQRKKWRVCPACATAVPAPVQET